MYLRHFTFTRFPFAANLEADELFASVARREAEARLKHLLELRGIGLLTGEVGCGKTTVCRHVTANLHPGLFRVFYVSLSTGNVLDMYKSIAWELGLPGERSRATAYRAIRAEITRLAQEARLLRVLVIDEAHPWLLEPLWSAGAVDLIGGAPKNWLALELAVAVGSGCRCLGRFAVGRPGPVLVFAAEDARRPARARPGQAKTMRDATLGWTAA